ncbi:IS1 family transposase, partial [Klebsiella pneumoniae]|uniref:IS1 family transposase n=1 Tax=Klebsiella pneumoniae TaxID=573 RepID=UPI003CF9B4D2
VSISCPSCSATDGVVRNGKSTAGHQRYLCSHCRKTWQLQFTYTASQPGTHQKIIDIQAWYESATPSSRGRPQRYSDLAITTVLVIKRVFRLTLRAAQGFIDSIFSLMNVPLR